MEIFLVNVNVSYKRVTLTWFSYVCRFLENNQLKVINMPKRHILWWYCFPTTSIKAEKSSNKNIAYLAI